MRPAERRDKQELLGTAIREHLEAARLGNTYHRYRAIEAELLLMSGRKGPIARMSQATLSRLQPVLHHAQSATFARLDHFGPEKRPEDVAATLATFFTSEVQLDEPRPDPRRRTPMTLQLAKPPGHDIPERRGGNDAQPAGALGYRGESEESVIQSRGAFLPATNRRANCSCNPTF